MHANIKSGPVGIYARFSSTLQNERSIDDQVRRCREHIKQQGGDPEAAKVFADFAISGSSLDRPGFEGMMTAVDRGAVKVIVTEDMSRISRDFADSAHIFKRLQFLQVPLVGVADGIDTSQKHAKLSFTVKSLVADLYLDDLRDKTLRGLEGRALQGFATGNVAYGYHTVPVPDGRGGVVGNRIEIHEAESAVVRRIFEMCRDGRSLAFIAQTLNLENVPSPRVGQRHRCFGWGKSTIQAMVRNERYAGVWRFKERQWVKVPGENRRQPRLRNAVEVIVSHRPELRIIDDALWTEVQARLAAVARRYVKNERQGGVPRKRTDYLLSSLLVCGQCGSPMSISSGTSASYYRCQTNRTKGTCSNRVSVREDVARSSILGAIQAHMLNPEGLAHLRRRIVEELADYSRKVEAEFKERKERLERTQQKLRGLVEFIASGDRSETVVSTLHDLEAYARSERAAMSQLEEEISKPIRLPTLDEVSALATDLQARLSENVEVGRAMLRRWLNEGKIRVDDSPDGPVGTTELLPLAILMDSARGKTRGRKLKITEDLVLSDFQLLTERSGGRIPTGKGSCPARNGRYAPEATKDRQRSPMSSPDSKLSLALESSGAYSMMDFARKHPSASLAELGQALGGVSPSEIERRFIDDAQDLDELRIHVQELLYRHVLNVGAGWPAAGDSKGQQDLREQLVVWQACARSSHFNTVLSAVTENLLAATHIPAGWKPSKASDPLLAEPFEKLWKIP